jgi:hypothetical protein
MSAWGGDDPMVQPRCDWGDHSGPASQRTSNTVYRQLLEPFSRHGCEGAADVSGRGRGERPLRAASRAARIAAGSSAPSGVVAVPASIALSVCRALVGFAVSAPAGGEAPAVAESTSTPPAAPTAIRPGSGATGAALIAAEGSLGAIAIGAARSSVGCGGRRSAKRVVGPRFERATMLFGWHRPSLTNV